jgi:hypothetical protein
MNAAKINEVCKARYGYDVLAINATAALWLAEHILETTGKNAYKAISRIRNAKGKYTMFPEYGTPLFAGI